MSRNQTADETDAQYQIGEVGVDEERIVEELIFSQAESLVDGIREVVQNGVDAPGSTEVSVSMTPEKTVVQDDGDGMDLADENVQEFLTHLGKSTKRDDDNAIGQFGIGFGQALAKGRVTVHTQDSKVEFDAKNWFREYRLYEADEYQDGFRVEIEHYDDEVPDPESSEWDDYQADLEDRFQFMELVHDVEVHVNGTRVSDEKPETGMYTVDKVYEDDKVYVAATEKDYDILRVYSAGLKVTTVDGHGLNGYVITKQNLDLNTARNSIRSGCELWEDVKKELDAIRAEVFRDHAADDLTEAGRKGVARLIGKGYSDFDDYPVFKKGNGEYASYEEITSGDDMIWAEKGDRLADKLADYGETVLLSDDGANEELATADERTDHVSLPDEKNGAATASSLGISLGYDEKDDEEVEDHRWNGQKLAMARVLAHKMGIDREIRFGEDPVANAWTDGESYIVLTDSAWNARHWAGWLQQIYRVLAHEAAHDEDSSGEPSHGIEFNRKFRKHLDKRDNAFTELSREMASDSVTDVIRRYRDVHGLDVE